MDTQVQEAQAIKARVIKVDSVETWDLYVTQATNQGCPVSLLRHLNGTQFRVLMTLLLNF